MSITLIKEATIALDGTITAAIQLNNTTDKTGGNIPMGYRVAGIQMPASWTAADLTFQASLDGTTYQDIYDKDGTEYTVTADAGIYIILPIADFAGIPYMKVRSGTSGTAVQQEAARTIQLALRQV